MSYRKLIALTVFGAAVFLQGCEDDEEAARTECSAGNIDLSDDADPALATTPDASNLFKTINDEIEVTDSELVTQATNCVACLLEEGAAYQADNAADLDEDNFETQLSCWQTNAAMKKCGATDDLPDCLSAASDNKAPCSAVTAISTTGLEGDCALCVAEEDTADVAKTADALEKCGAAVAEFYNGCTGKANSGAAAAITFADLSGTSYLTKTGTDEPYDTGNTACISCIDAAVTIAANSNGATADGTAECNLLKSIYTDVCKGTFTNAVTCS